MEPRARVKIRSGSVVCIDLEVDGLAIFRERPSHRFSQKGGAYAARASLFADHGGDHTS